MIQKKKNCAIKINDNIQRYNYHTDKKILRTYLLDQEARAFFNCNLQKPSTIKGSKRLYHMKDRVYKYTKEMHTDKYNIKGSYIGLAAARTLEIAANFYSTIENHKFVNCQNDISSFIKLKMFNNKIKGVLKAKNIQTIQKFTDILTYLKEGKEQYSIIDLDFMCSLKDIGFIFKILDAVEHSASNKSTVLIWHCYGRRSTKQDSNEGREILYIVFDKVFKVLRYDSIDYWEGFPLRTDIFTIQR